MKAVFRVTGAVALSLLLIFGSSLAAYAWSAQDPVQGNDPSMGAYSLFKIGESDDDAVIANFSNGVSQTVGTVGGFQVNGTFTFESGEPKTFQWEVISDHVVDYVFVKGGTLGYLISIENFPDVQGNQSGGYLYTYSGGAQSSSPGTFLTALPQSASNYHGISHVTFYFRDKPDPDPDPEPDPDGELIIEKVVILNGYDGELPTFEFEVYSTDESYYEVYSLVGAGETAPIVLDPSLTYIVKEIVDVDSPFQPAAETPVEYEVIFGDEDGYSFKAVFTNAYIPPQVDPDPDPDPEPDPDGELIIEKVVILNGYDGELPTFEFEVYSTDESYYEVYSLVGAGETAPIVLDPSLTYIVKEIVDVDSPFQPAAETPVEYEVIFGDEDGYSFKAVFTNAYIPPQVDPDPDPDPEPDPDGELIIEKVVILNGYDGELPTFEFEVYSTDESYYEVYSLVGAGETAPIVLDPSLTYIVKEIVDVDSPFQPAAETPVEYEVIFGDEDGYSFKAVFTNAYIPPQVDPEPDPDPIIPDPDPDPEVIPEPDPDPIIPEPDPDPIIPEPDPEVIPAIEEALILIDEEEVPLGPAFVPVDSSLPPESEPEDNFELILLDEDVPLGDALPLTGHVAPLGFYGIGAMLSAIGVYLKKKSKI